MPLHASVVAAVRALPDADLAALVRDHATDRELGELLRRGIVGEVPPERKAPARRAAPPPRSAKPSAQPPSGKRRRGADDDEKVIAAVRGAGPSGAKVSVVAAAIGRTPAAARFVCARLVKAGRISAHGATSTRVYKAAA